MAKITYADCKNCKFCLNTSHLQTFVDSMIPESVCTASTTEFADPNKIILDQNGWKEMVERGEINHWDTIRVPMVLKGRGRKAPDFWNLYNTSDAFYCGAPCEMGSSFEPKEEYKDEYSRVRDKVSIYDDEYTWERKPVPRVRKPGGRKAAKKGSK